MTPLIDMRETGEGVELTVLVQPHAGKTGVVGVQAGALKIRVAAAPEKGRATAECRRLLAELLEMRQADVEIIAGATARRKRVRLRGMTLSAVQMKVKQWGR
jgi:hypothetical protein